MQGQQHNFRNFNVEDGLGQSQVYSVFQNEQGYIYLGTRGGGISVFDGFGFKTYTEADGLSSNYVNEIIGLGTAKANMLIATNRGVNFLSGNTFSPVEFEGEEALAVRDIFEAKDESVYCASNKGIYKMLGKSSYAKRIVKDIEQATSIDVWGKELWIGTNKGLYRSSGDKLEHMGEVSKYMNNSITCLTRGKDGKLWIGTYGDGMYCYDGERFFRIDHQHELYRQTVLDVYTDDVGGIWIATLASGIIHFDGTTGVFQTIGENEGLSNNHVRSIFKDNNANFWFGTSGGGVCQYLGEQFTNYDRNSGLAGDFIYSVLRDSKGRLWVGNAKKGVSVIEGSEIVNYNAQNEFEDVKVKALAEDHNGEIWLGTDGHGVYVYDGEKFKSIRQLRRAFIKQIKVDKKGHVWMATAGNGLIEIFKRNSNYIIQEWGVRQGTLSNRLTSLHFDKKGRLWYAMESHGIGCFNPGGKDVWVSKEEGLSTNLIRSLAEDQRGNLWIGTAGGGVCAFPLYTQNPKIRTISMQSGLSSDNIYSLTLDSKGHLLVGSEKGIDYVYFAENGALSRIKHYGRADGFTGVETCQNSVWNDLDGTIWFGTIHGLCRFNPSQLVGNPHPPLLSFLDVKLFYESMLEDRPNMLSYGKQIEELSLGYSDNHITFDFLGMNLQRPNDVLYRWRLEGFDPGWSPVSKDRSIMYSNLNPGKYRFLLVASNEDGVWTKEPLIFTFEIETPYWETAWFRIAVGTGLILILIISYKLTVRRIRRKARERQEKLENEMDFLELEQKALRLQMNPHFIFNALNSIQSLIGTGKETEARYYLAKFSRLMRQILDNSRKTEISLQEEVDTLENYLLIEKFCSGNVFDYEVITDEELEIDFIRIPPMLLQPFVENAIKHGMKGRKAEDPGTIIINFEEKGTSLICTISDNGVGREAAALRKEKSKETYHESTSLIVIRERLELLTKDGGEALKIVDLEDDQGNAAGTKVIVRIPLD